MNLLIKGETGLNLRHSPPGFPDLFRQNISEFDQNMAAIAAELPAPFGASFLTNLLIKLKFCRGVRVNLVCVSWMYCTRAIRCTTIHSW